MVARSRRLLADYPELATVVVAAALGLTASSPLSWLDHHHGVNVLLVVLVFATAVTIDPADLRAVATSWRPLVAALLAGITVLPALSWLVARVVAAGSLRNGVLSVGLAPCEIASVATTGMAGGTAAVSAGVLIGSTVATVAVAGPILGLEAGGGASIHPAHIIVNLALIVALPLAAGLVLGALKPPAPRAKGRATVVATIAVAALVALIASQVHLSSRYVRVLGALVLFLAGSAALGWLLGRGSGRPTGTALQLTTSMRDFAIAAGLASAAFGATAAAPLGVYGILVLVWGTAVAGVLRSRGTAPA